MALRIVLITGANSGIGYAASQVLANASEAFHVIMTGRSLEAVQTAMSEIKSAGITGSLSAIQLDVTDEHSVQRAAKRVEQEHDHLDALINNAGVAALMPDTKTRLQIAMNTNVIGPAVVASYFRPLLLKSKESYSIFVSSGAGSITKAAAPGHFIANDDAYRSSKAALNMLAVLEARDYGERGMKVFALCPGFMISNLRGKDEHARGGWGGGASDPKIAGEFILSVLRGERDKDVGKHIHRDGIYPW